MRPSRAPRLLRGALAAGIATFAALVSHVAGGGSMPGWVGIAIPLTVSLVVCTALAGRRLSLPRLSLAVALSQALFHTLFVLGTFAPAAAPGVAGRHVHGVVALPAADADALAHIHADPRMWLMHGVAAVVTIAALYRGERACKTLRAVALQLVRSARRLLDPPAAAALAPARTPAPEAAAPKRPAPSCLVFSVTRRGPPLLAAR